MEKKCIGVIIVVYNPDVEELWKKLELLDNDINIVVVDNTSGKSVDLSPLNNVDYIPLHKNTGIANAQNKGIGHLVGKGCSHIVFFDQDSMFDNIVVHGIVNEYKRIEQAHSNLFLLGPQVVNKESGKEYRSVIHKENTDNIKFSAKRDIISSGSCASVKKICDVGMMESELFIDYVDFEYCWRSEAKGYVCGTTGNVVLPHKVGRRELHIFQGYSVIISAPFRYYYQYRNYLWLCRRRYVPFSWKINTGIKLFLRIFYFPLAVNGWRSIEKYMFKGIYHGIFKRNL